MSGIYIHIPFCKSKCFYCDFYKVAGLKYKNEFLSALYKEFLLKKDFLHENKIDTVYFGGGTPTLLTINEINNIFSELGKYFLINPEAEITIEANPDDLTDDYIFDLRNKTKINRISVGIQSFDDVDLKLMNRRHTGKQAFESVIKLKNAGFTNISGDLIYGLPEMTVEKLIRNLNIFIELNIPHLSAYHLSYESGTIFEKFLKSNKIKPIEEDNSILLFNELVSTLNRNAYIMYEVSSFAKKDNFSQHNSSYWLQKNYIGFGPSAHSFDGDFRSFNVNNLKTYLDRVGEGADFYQTEKLSVKDKYNEYVMTSLRTIWGVSIEFLKAKFGVFYTNYFLVNLQPYLNQGLIENSDVYIKLTKSGMMISDRIISDLFYVD